MNRIWPILLASTLFIACGSDEAPPSDKGAEENPLTDGKSDSFFRPTEHGEASFTRANHAEINEDQTFHAWNFELSSEATIELKTEISTRNLDTVMYLYHRKNEDQSWGRYVAKNDDHRGNLWSQIDGEFDTGLYRVIVKPFKSSMSGAIALRAACEGEGCPVVEAGECAPDEYAELPSETGFGAGCTERILEVVTSELQFENQLDVTVGEKCSLNALAARAVDYYVSYWNDVVGFEDLFGGNGDPIRLNVEEYSHDRGTVIWIDAYADEDGMRFVFDNDGELLGLYQSNQSPDHRFYCASEVNRGAEFPGCWSRSIEDLRWTGNQTTEDSGSTTSDEEALGELDPTVAIAVSHFADINTVAEGVDIAWESTSWEGSFTNGAEVRLSSGDLASTYWLAGGQLTAVSDPEGARYLCEFYAF